MYYGLPDILFDLVPFNLLVKLSRPSNMHEIESEYTSTFHLLLHGDDLGVYGLLLALYVLHVGQDFRDIV